MSTGNKFEDINWDSYDEFEKVMFDKNVIINWEFLLDRARKNPSVLEHLERKGVLGKIIEHFEERGVL